MAARGAFPEEEPARTPWGPGVETDDLHVLQQSPLLEPVVEQHDVRAEMRHGPLACRKAIGSDDDGHPRKTPCQEERLIAGPLGRKPRPAAIRHDLDRRPGTAAIAPAHDGDADEVAATFGVSRAWVHRLAQRHRETGSIAPRKQTKFRSRVLAGQEARLSALITARPDSTLAELREALPTTAALSTLWLEIDRLGLTAQKKPYTLTNNVVLMSRPRGVGGARPCRSTMRHSTSSSTSPA